MGELAPSAPVHDDLIEELVDFVHETVGLPMDTWAVAATLESRGLRDVDAIERYGAKSIFHLAESIYPAIQQRGLESLAEESRPKPDVLKVTRRFLRFVHLYAKGLIFALPMAGQIIAVLVLRYSLWAWLDFDNLTATLVAIGTVGSFLVTGGLVQAVGREGTFYRGQENAILLDRCMRLLVVGGAALAVAVAALALLSNLLFPFFAWRQLGIVLTYFLLLSPLWLALAVLYMLEDHVIILGATLLGTGVVHLVMQTTDWGIVPSHVLGLLSANGVAVAWSWLRIRRMKRTVDPKYRQSRLPRPAVLLHIVEPYLLYGICYFTLLFVDRLVAWSASDYPLPLIIWFRTPYELGMDWALFSLVFTIAILEFTIHEFSATIIPKEQWLAGRAHARFSADYGRFYRRQVKSLAVGAVLSITVTFLAVSSLRRYDYIMEVNDFFASPVTYFVFFGASVGYSILAFGLLNALFFFSLSQPWVVVRAIAPALVVDLAVGFVASRAIGYEYAVLGLVAGATVFAVRSWASARELFAKLDFYYYAAF